MFRYLISSGIALLMFCVVNAQTKSAEDYYADGKDLKDNGKCEDAIVDFKKAIALKPDYADALFAAGWCSNELEKYSDAIGYLEKAKVQWPHVAKVYLELGFAEQYSDRIDDAVESYNKVLELDDTYYLAYRYLGNVYCNSKFDYQKALDYYKKYEQNETDIDEVILYNMGFCENELEDYDNAIPYLKKALDKKSDDGNAYYELGWAYYSKDNSDADAAIENFNKAKSYLPESNLPYLGLGDVYKDLKGDADLALSNFKKSLELNPKSKVSNYGIGWSYNDKEEYDAAVPYLKQALELDDQYTSAMTELGYSYYKLKKLDDAVSILKKSKTLRSSNLSLYYLGLCYVELGQKGNAREVYDDMKEKSYKNADDLLAKINNM